MASLADTLANNKKLLTRGPGGQLSEESTEEVQSLADKAGLAAPPTTALGQAAIGANPHQQKMAGTPAQMGKALSLSMDPNQSLSDATRRAQVRTEQTGTEQQQSQKSQAMQELGALGDRVHSFIESQRTNLANQAQTQTAGPVTQAASTFQNRGTEADLSPIADKISALRADPNNMELQLEVNKFLGRDINSVISPDEINQLYETAQAAVSRAGATAVDDNLTVEDLTQLPTFGYNAQQLSDLLGLPADQISQMSVAQLRQAIQNESDQEFSNTQKLQQQAVSGNLGAAERGLAQQAAQEASATGTRTAEQNVQDLNQQIANADRVLFGGKEWNVEDLLKDENISKLVSDYMSLPEGSPDRAELERTEPGLVAFIKKNEQLFGEASKQLQTGATEFGGIQEANKQVANFGDAGALTQETAKALIPNFGELAAKKIDREEVPALAYISHQDPAGQRTAVQNINEFTGAHPDYTKELSTLSEDELDALGFGTGSFGQKIAPLEQRKLVETTNNLDDIIRVMSGGQLGAGSSRAFQEANAVQALGLGTKDPTFAKLDDNNDGVPDDINTLRQRALPTSGNTSLRDLIGGTFNAAWSRAPQQSVPRSGIEGSLMNRMGQFAGDGRITADEVRAGYEQIMKGNDQTSGMDPQTARDATNELLMLSKAKGLDSGAREQLGQHLTKARKANTYYQLEKDKTSSGRPGNVQDMQRAADNIRSLPDKLNDPQYDQEAIRNIMKSEATKFIYSNNNQGRVSMPFQAAYDMVNNKDLVRQRLKQMQDRGYGPGDNEYDVLNNIIKYNI